MITPRQQTPSLSLPLVGGDHFDLSMETPNLLLSDKLDVPLVAP
jgi:hypothetical protein